MSITQDVTARSFPPEPVSAREARRFLRAFLLEHARDDLVDDAGVALSEIVTNSVLHAHTDLEVQVALSGDGRLRVEVTDRNPQLPAQRGYGDQATTGRGMQLVAAVTQECGVVSHGARGKTVWFLVSASASTEAAPGAGWDVPRAPAPSGDDDGSRSSGVLLLGLPPTLWLAARQHHDAILRELGLYAQEHPEQAPPPERFAQADAARGVVSAAVVAELDRRARSAPCGEPATLRGSAAPFDLSVQVAPDAPDGYAALQDVLDAGERLASAGLLLARPGLPEVVAVRDWVCEQIIAQHSGVLPSAWRGTDDVVDAPAPPASLLPDDEIEAVTGAQVGVIAADDANRIVAVSRPLAELLGWSVDDLVGRRVVALVPPELREAHVAGFSRHLTTGETHVLGVPVQLPVLRADGSRLLCDVLIEQRTPVSGRHLYVAWMQPAR